MICIKVINCQQVMPSSNKSIHLTFISKSILSIFFNLQYLTLSISIYVNTSLTSPNLKIPSIPSSNLIKPSPSTYKIFFVIYQVLPTISYLSIKSTSSNTLLSFQTLYEKINSQIFNNSPNLNPSFYPKIISSHIHSFNDIYFFIICSNKMAKFFLISS